MSWKVESVPELNGYTVEFSAEGNYILSKRNRLYSSSNLKRPFNEIAVISAPRWKRAASLVRLAQRLLRFMVTNVFLLANGELFVTFDKSVGIVRDGKYYALNGLVRPCRVLRSACAVDDIGDVYFGEYLANNEKREIRIYRYSPGNTTVETAHTFPAGAVKHVHGLYYDNFTKSIVCLTGDRESECKILQSFDGFKTTQIIGEGDETWRAVSILFDGSAYFYGTDAEFRSNSIYRVDRQTLKRSILVEVDGTVFYSKQIAGDMFFTTTAENAPSQKENVAAIWHVDGEDNCTEMMRFHKDRWHGTLFMFGTIHFPSSLSRGNEIYFTVVGVKEDSQTFRLVR